jgi:hypothetical protein
MATSSSRFGIERQKLCIWLESEKRKLQTLPTDLKIARDLELEREFKNRLDRLYGEMQQKADSKGPATPRTKLN